MQENDHKERHKYKYQKNQAQALKLLNGMDSRKKQYLEQQKQNQLLQLYNHKKVMNPSRRQHHSP